jgi:nucleotide-binding universal stress UspA family protein
VLSVVEVSDRELLAQGMGEARNSKQTLDRLVGGLQLEGIPVKVVVKIAHRISYAVTETALEERCNLIVMGRARRVGLIERFAATIVDRVVRSTPAQMMVVTAERFPDRVDNILLAYERGPHSELTADLAKAFGADHKTRLRAVHVMQWRASRQELERAGEEMNKELGDQFPQREQKVVQAGDIVSGLLRQSRNTDLILIGGTEAGVIEQLLAYAPPLELADRTAIPVITVYEMAAEPKRWII